MLTLIYEDELACDITEGMARASRVVDGVRVYPFWDKVPIESEHIYPSPGEIERLSVGACLRWSMAATRGLLVCAGDLPNGTVCVSMSGFRFVRDGFLKDRRYLGCKNKTLNGQESCCCTFALVVPMNGVNE